MLDIKFIRENPEIVKNAVKIKNGKVDIDELLKLDSEARQLQTQADAKRAEQKQKSKMARGESTELKELKIAIQELEKQETELEVKLRELLYQVPNIPFADVPVGKDESENVVAREVGAKRDFGFKPKDYLAVAEALDIIDVKTSAEVSGTRFGYLKGGAALLEFALIQFALSVFTSQEKLSAISAAANLGAISPKPFVPVVPPVMIKPEVLQKMARLDPADDRYHIPSDELYLVGSAEHTLGPLHMNHTFAESELPVRYVGFSTSFRRESGSYGRDTKGIIRVHQFDKVEVESFCLSETSRHEQDFIVACQEYLWQQLGIPYQVMSICTGDMGAPDARQIDINAWMPGQGTYREVTTSDLNTDYQARRLGTRVKREGKTEYVHMIDATGFAIGRTLIAIIENYQQADGTINIPEVLWPFMGGIKVIGKA